MAMQLHSQTSTPLISATIRSYVSRRSHSHERRLLFSHCKVSR